MLLKQLVYMIAIYSVIGKIPIDYVFNYFNHQNPREASSRSRLFPFSLVYVFIKIHVRIVYLCIFICVTFPDQTKNYIDLKFGTHTAINLI